MLSMLRTSVAIIAATAVMAPAVLAQTAPTSAAPAVTAPPMATPAETAAPDVVRAAPAATPATTSTAAAAPQTNALPAVLTDLGISEATILPGRKGDQRVEGKLPDGSAFHGKIDEGGKLRMMRALDGAVLPDDIVRRLVPEAVRNAPVFPEIARLEGVAISDGGVSLFGADAKGEQLRAGFDADGTLKRFGRGKPERDHAEDRDRPGHGPDSHGPKGGKRHGHGDHGPNEKRAGRFGDRDDARDDGRLRGGPADAAEAGQGQGAPVRLDDAAIQSLLTDGGYTSIGSITRNGPRAEVETVNPQGEPVTVTISGRGVVVRELSR